MEHTDEKQNGEQQPSVEKVEYCVDDNLVCEDEILFYKLRAKGKKSVLI